MAAARAAVNAAVPAGRADTVSLACPADIVTTAVREVVNWRAESPLPSINRRRSGDPLKALVEERSRVAWKPPMLPCRRRLECAGWFAKTPKVC